MFRSLTVGMLLFANSLSAEGPAEIAPQASNGLVSAFAVQGDSLFAVGERGHFFKWTDRPEQQPFPGSMTLTSIAAAGPKLWAVGFRDSIFVREGTEWKEKSTHPRIDGALFSIHFSTPTHGIAVGSFGVALATSDGETWAPLDLGVEDAHLYQVKSDAAGNWFVAGEFATLVKLTPDFQVAKRYGISGVEEASYFGVEILGDEDLLVYGITGKVARFKGDTKEMIANPKRGSLFCSVKVGNDVLLFGAEGSIVLLRDGVLIDRSTSDKRMIIDAVVYGDKLILGTVGGIREMPLAEVLK